MQNDAKTISAIEACYNARVPLAHDPSEGAFDEASSDKNLNDSVDSVTFARNPASFEIPVYTVSEILTYKFR